ncbi:reverse transcriptase domain-containing protein [Tanacetum coccineum]
MNKPLLANPRRRCGTRLGEERSQLRKIEVGPRLTQPSEKFSREKEKSEKLKELKSRLNFEGCSGTSQYPESKMMDTKEHEKRHISRRPRSPRTSVFSRIRREQSRSPRQLQPELPFKIHRSSLKNVETTSEGGNGSQIKERNRIGKRMTCPSRGYDSLKIFQAAAKTERWAMPTWCHMFNSTMTGNARVWFDDLPPESIDRGIPGGMPQITKGRKRFHHGNNMKAAKSKFSKKEVSGTNKGKPPHLIKELKQNNGKEQPKVAKKRETSGKDKAPRVRNLQAVPSSAHGMLKISVEGGVITLKSSKLVPLECAVVSGPEGAPSATKLIIEERIKVAINPEYPEQTVMIGFTLTEEGRNKLCGLLQRNLDIFAWKLADMTGVPRNIAEHRLNVREGCSPVRQKKRGQAADRNQAIQEEVRKLVEAGIMKEVHYHELCSTQVMVKKHDDSWRMCVDFKDLNKACPKDGYPLPEIDWKVESLCGFPFKCFLDAYKGYHQIQMAKEDEEKTAFFTSQGIFCYTKMPFGLRNAGATYQRLVDKAFHKQIGRNLEPRVSVKWQILADFIVERPKEDSPDTLIEEEEELPESWILFTDGSSCTDGSGAGLILTNPEGMEFTYALRFRFDATNNEAEYEACCGLRIAEN